MDKQHVHIYAAQFKLAPPLESVDSGWKADAKTGWVSETRFECSTHSLHDSSTVNSRQWTEIDPDWIKWATRWPCDQRNRTDGRFQGNRSLVESVHSLGVIWDTAGLILTKHKGRTGFGATFLFYRALYKRKMQLLHNNRIHCSKNVEWMKDQC